MSPGPSMKSFLIFILSWAALFAGAYELFHDRFYPPGDLIGAAIISFFAALGIGALRKARIDRKDAALAGRPEGPPRDGERVAISGTIKPSGAPLRAPFSGVECIAYDYTVTHRGNRGTSDTRQTVIQDRLGIALAPCVIHSPAGGIGHDRILFRGVVADHADLVADWKDVFLEPAVIQVAVRRDDPVAAPGSGSVIK